MAVISIVENTRIPAPPERIWEFFIELDDRYAEWLPEHLTWRTMRGEPLSEGAVIFVDEWVGPLRVTGRCFIVESQPNRLLAYRIGFPASIVCAGGSFLLTPTADGECDLREEAHLGFSVPVIGPLIDLILRLVLPLHVFRRHIREEGEGLIRLLSGPQPGPTGARD